MPNCCVPNCKNSPENGFLLRCFPRNEVLRAEWARNINRPGWVPNHCHRICEVHFAPRMWEKTRVDGTRKLKYNAVPTVFKNHIVEESVRTAIVILPVGVSNISEIKVKKNDKVIVKILPPANSKNAKPIILPASFFENQLNSSSTIIVNTEGKIINSQQSVSSGPKSTSILKTQVKPIIVSSPTIISTHASSSIVKSQIKSASNQSPIVVPANGSILKSQFQITKEQTCTQQPNIINSKSANNQSILIPLSNAVQVQNICTQNANLQQIKTTLSSATVTKVKVETNSKAMFTEEFNDVEINTVGIGSNAVQLKKIADERFEKMDKLLLKQLKLNNALRKRLASVNHKLHQKTKEKDKDFKEFLKDVFTEDQMRAIELRHINPKSITAWSYKTMIKAIKLKESCGTQGYEELLRQNMPLPSIRTISRWCTQRNIPIP